jgi:hypothetical protein
MFLLTVFSPEEERSLYFITARNTKTCIYGLSLECRVMARRFGLPHTWMLCLPFDLPTGSCLWLCLHTHQSCHNRQLICNASLKTTIKSVCFLFQCETGRQSTVWNTSVQRCWSRTNGKVIASFRCIKSENTCSWVADTQSIWIYVWDTENWMLFLRRTH